MVGLKFKNLNEADAAMIFIAVPYAKSMNA